MQEKRGFKYVLSTTTTLKIWNNATNTYDIEEKYFNAEEIVVANQIFNLNTAYEELNTD